MCGSIARRSPSGMALVPALSRSWAAAFSSTPVRMNEKLMSVMAASLWLSDYYVAPAARGDFHRDVELAAQALEVGDRKEPIGLALGAPGLRECGQIGNVLVGFPRNRLRELVLVHHHGDRATQ